MIKYTDEQQQIVDYILEQVDAGALGKNVIVSGQGGTGKTTMVCQLVCTLLLMGKRVAVSAMTGKATAVLRQKIYKTIYENKLKDEFPKENLLVETIQKITKESKIVDVNESGETIYSNTWKDPTAFDYDVLIIDELSMVPHFISLWWQRTPALVIGLGDYCQLPEVTSRESQQELVGFRHDLKLETGRMVAGYGIKVLKDLSECHLTQVLRSDNEIALLSNDLRDFTKGRQQVVDIMKEWAKKAPEAIQYTTDLSELEMGEDWQIICYTNKMCDKINNALCKGGEYPTMEDKILLFDNIPPLQKFNGDTITLKSLLDSIKRYNTDPKHSGNPITVILKWKNEMPKRTSKYRLEREMSSYYGIFKESLKKAQEIRMAFLPKIINECGYSSEQIKEWQNEIKTLSDQIPDRGECFSTIIKRFYEIDRDLAQQIMDKSPPIPRMYVVHIDYGYAVTTHKSQGSEYKNVCYLLERFDRPLLYTGVSRAKEKVKIINLTNVT